MARALAWHARGHRFDPDILHYPSGFCGRQARDQVPAFRTPGPVSEELFDILAQARL